MNNLDALLAPKSVAVIGASNDPSRIGGRALKMLFDTGFAGPIYPVNPTRSEVQGVKAYASIEDIGAPVDCVIVTIPAALVVEAVRQCAAVGARSAVIFSGGFAEAEGDGARMQAELGAIAAATGIRIVGPNCIGLYNAVAKTYVTFLATAPRTFVRGKNVGVVTQSGGYGAHILGLAQQRGLSVGHWVTTGNECDVEFGEMLAEFADDPDVDVLVGYVEGLRSRDNIMRALDIARCNCKPVILMKAGHTAEGAMAAASHTASMAGTDTAYDALFEAYGVYRARSTEEVLDIAYAVTSGRMSGIGSIGVLTNSGGMGVQIADFVSASELKLAPIPAEAQDKIHEYVPSGSGRNPIDVTAQWVNDPTLIKRCLNAAFDSVKFSTFLFFFGNGANPVIRETITEIAKAHPECQFVMCFIHNEEHVAFYESIGCLYFEEPARAIRAIAALEGFTTYFARSRGGDDLSLPSMPLLPANAQLNERDAKAILAQCGISVLKEIVVESAIDASQVARDMPHPVAIKIVSPDIIHKSDVGGVVLDLADAEAVHVAATAMLARVAQSCPEARIEGILVSPMIAGGVECIIGVHRDPALGPMIMVGMGGVAVELIKDVVWSLVPVSPGHARDMLERLKLFPLLNGYRGAPEMDIDALVDAIVALSHLADGNSELLQSIEVNPIYVLPKGKGAVALDAVISTRAPVVISDPRAEIEPSLPKSNIIPLKVAAGA